MKITIWGINYEPEPTGIGPFNTDLCAWLASRGHEVTMLTSFPYYPWWRKRPEDRGKFFETSRRADGVTVRRCWHYVPGKPSTLKRLVHELSFVFTSTLRALFLPRPDVFVVVSPPLFLGLGAFVAGLLLRRPFVFHVQDLQPDAALGLGMIKPGPAVRALHALEKWSYRRAALVSGISQGMMDAFARKRVPRGKTWLFANWIPDALPAAASAAGGAADGAASFRRANRIADGTVLIAYSGNVGMKQGLEVAVAASVGTEAHWAVCGEGAAKESLAALVAATPGSRVRLYPLQPDDSYQALLREADVSLITQQRGTGQFFFPSKLLSILQHGRPVLAVADADSELARAVAAGGFGRVVPPGDAEALRTAAREMAAADAAQKQAWAENGRGWVAQFRRSRVLAEFEARLAQVIAPAAGDEAAGTAMPDKSNCA
ncbi:WcaI family glycosyltransferase [Termitidicoccus mucosus]|uniref:WcaI family glycosyltransferase n=1 Tax=Termitidicoccus mucosus TaxID=1184151 RepID=UPI000838FB06